MTQFEYTLNQIFYGYKKFDDPGEICKTFSPFFFQPIQQELQDKSPQSKIQQIQSHNQSIQPHTRIQIQAPQPNTTTTTPNPTPTTKDWFHTNYSDSLFWCIFRHVYGEFEYMNIGSRYGNRMLEEKQKIMEFFLKTPKHLKDNSNIKFTNARVQETCSEFLCDKKTSPIVLAAYAVYYGINIYLVDDDKHTYIKFLCLTDKVGESDDDKSERSPCWIYKTTKYKLYLSCDKSEEYIQPSHCCLEQFDKPLLGISHYKLQDLENLEKKLQLNQSTSTNDTKKKSKTERYELISKQMSWEW